MGNKIRRTWKIRLLTRQVQWTMDLGVLVSAFVFAYLLRFDFVIPEQEFPRALVQLPWVVLIQFAALIYFGVYAFIWRYIGLRETKAFVFPALASLFPILIARLALPVSLPEWRVPLSIILMDTILAFGGVLALRVLRRAQFERHQKRRGVVRTTNGRRKSVLLIGAGRAGVLAAKEIFGRGDADIEIAGFVDDDPRKQNFVINGVKVRGTTRDVPRLVRELGIDHVVITIAEAPGQEIRRIVGICEQIPIKVRIIPGFYEILEGNVEVSRIRDVQIEDLLGRESVQLDQDSVARFLAGKTVMVTGAGGSIGSELVRQAARFQPKKLILVERAEFALFSVDRELSEACLDLNHIPLVADVGDEARMRSIFAAHRPQIVLHAAAHKHVPLMEFNVTEAVKNNALATHAVGELAAEFGAEAFVLISTDKAVCPTSIMGASKRIAELVIQDLNEKRTTRYVAVRFGNVIGSTGSVVPIFQEQIRKGGPLTVTNPDMIRYFMTIPEAAQLVLQAGAMGEGGEIFVLDMGRPVRILDLAKDLIRLSGLKPFEDIDIVFTGARPGEKLFEELEITEECMAKTRHPKILVGKIAARPADNVCHMLEQLRLLSTDGQEQELRAYLSDFLPEARLEGVPPNSASDMVLEILQEGALPLKMKEAATS
ncbi:MAG: nucleoside-diphosphate sugar epimerase/dehydratase [Acidobacteriota bacterium]